MKQDLQETRIRSFRDLLAWKLAKALAVEIYRTTREFPRDERFSMTSQLRRAATSVPANIAEGWARNHRKEYVHFVSIALGSLAEVETLLEISLDVEFLPKAKAQALEAELSRIRALLLGLRRSLDRSAPGEVA